MASSLFIKPAQAEQDLKWAKIWFKKFAVFHNRSPHAEWDFSPDDVIAFLRSKRDAGVPAWKRMKVIRGLLVYRRFIAEKPIDDLLPIKQKMEEIFRIERARDDGYDSIDESVGKINPKEPDAIRAPRRPTTIAARSSRAGTTNVESPIAPAKIPPSGTRRQRRLKTGPKTGPAVLATHSISPRSTVSVWPVG